MSNECTLHQVRPEVIAEWKRIGSLSYIWNTWVVRELRARLLWLTTGLVIFLSVSSFFGWLEPSRTATIYTLLAFGISIALIVAVVILGVSTEMQKDRQKLLNSRGLEDLDARDVGLLGENKPNLLCN